MRSFGLKPSEIDLIKKYLQKHFGSIPDVKVFLFGSRAKGSHKPFSDIDLAIKSKSSEIKNKIALFKEDWDNSNLPYKVDISEWRDLYKPYLPEINKTKKSFWVPSEKELHPWRICPYGEHWVVRHPRYPLGRQLQDVDGHCRKNKSGKDLLKSDEIDLISKLTDFQETKPLPNPYKGLEKINDPNKYDIFISGWCRYWNEILKPEIAIDPNFVKALIESESRFNPNAIAQNKKEIGPARGLIQITESTWRILKNQKGEIKDHFIVIKKEDLFDPNINICVGIRWLFRKKEVLQRRLGRSPQWTEVIVEYKGLGPGLKKNNSKSLQIIQDFNKIYKKYQIAK